MVKPLRKDQFGIWVRDHTARRLPKTEKMRPQEALAKERRDPIRRAYFAIRSDPSQSEMARLFARALGGKIKITEDMLREANRIVTP